MNTFATEFRLWADALGVEWYEIEYVLRFLERVEALPPDEREATRAALDEIGAPIAAQMVELAEGVYLEWTVNERARQRVPLVRAARRTRELREMPYREYLQTSEWRNRAEDTYRRFGYRCALCNRPSDLEAHHRTYERRGDEQDEDLTAVCATCHGWFHEWLDLFAEAETAR